MTANNFVRASGPMAFGAMVTALGIAPVFWILAATMAGAGWIAWETGKSKGESRKADG